MHRRWYIFLPLFFAALLYGCATLIHGTTQDVSIIAPQGTQVREVSGNNPIILSSSTGNITLRLKRNKDYAVKFSYKGQEAFANFSSSLEPGWLIADFFTDFIGYIVDGVTGAWNSFDDPIAVRFLTDSTLTVVNTSPSIEVVDDFPTPKIGLVVTADLGFAFPMEVLFGSSYGIGVGYEVSPRLTLLVAYRGGSGVNVLSRYSVFYTSGSFDHFNIEGRFKANKSIYLTAGGGISNISTDSLELDRSTYNDDLGRVVDNTLRLAPSNKWMPTLFAGIGMSGSVGFIELRQTIGLSHFPLSNGETGHFSTTSLTFGVNLRF